MKKCASVYYAMKEIIEEYSLDMVTVKCIGEFMDSYCSCCVALSMLNDEGYICGCQCNLNALLSGYILSALSKEPHFFGDVNMVDTKEGVARMIHCGSAPGAVVAPKGFIEFHRLTLKLYECLYPCPDGLKILLRQIFISA